jgi:hypothetical protein
LFDFEQVSRTARTLKKPPFGGFFLARRPAHAVWLYWLGGLDGPIYQKIPLKQWPARARLRGAKHVRNAVSDVGF